MFDLVAAVNNDQTLGDNLLRSPVLLSNKVKLHLQRGYPSAALAYNAALPDCCNDLVVFAHQDVYLPNAWEHRLMESVLRLEVMDPDWAVLGVFGITLAGEHAGSVWSSGLNAAFGATFGVPVRVQSVDELLIVVNRSSSICFDEALPGYHLYGTDIVQAALAAGKGAYAVHAPVIHNSRPCLYLGDDYFQAYKYIAHKWRHHLPIQSSAAPVLGSGLRYLRFRLRHKVNELRYSYLDRQSLDRNHDCVDLAKRLGFE